MKDEIYPLTSLRFVAAFYVFAFHMNIRWPLAERGSVLESLLSHGAAGMSVFFILSGFVLAYHYRNGVGDLVDYARMRFSRIYPVYIVAGLVTIPWLVSGIERDSIGLGSAAARYLFIIFSNITLIQAWFPQLFGYWNDGASWSISVEMFFYLLFPFCFALVLRLNVRVLIIFLVGFYFAASLPGICYILFPNPPSSLIYYSIPIFRFSEFIVGVVCGVLFIRGLRVYYPSLTFCVFCSILVVYFSGSSETGYVFVSDNWLIVPCVAMIVFSSACMRVGIYKIIANRLFVYLGRISYSFYSFQALVLFLLIDHHSDAVKNFSVLSDNYILCSVAFLVLVLISMASHFFIEIKFRPYFNKLWVRSGS